MTPLLRQLLLAGLLAFTRAQAADDEQPKKTMKERLRERMAEDAKKLPSKSASAPGTPAAAPKPGAAPSEGKTAEKPESPPKAATTATAPAPGKASAVKSAEQSATVLPKVEVKKSRITELDQKLAKQNQDIERERKNLRSSEVDNALNDSKVARLLSIFGGESTQFRKGVAAERIELMEAEKDVMEAIARARTKEEKELLQKQLDELKKLRRDLEKAMR